MPRFVLIFLALQLGFGLILVATAIRSLLQWRKHRASMVYYHPKTQMGIWAGLLVACIFCLFFRQTLIALLFLVCAQLFPKDQRKPVQSPEQPAIEPDDGNH